MHHPTGLTYDRDGVLTTLRNALATYRGLARREEPLATLGDSLALLHALMSADGTTAYGFDVGAFERENFSLVEVDAHGLRRHTELFAADRLGDAIARLYARYAELLPDGPERSRATTTARAIAIQLWVDDAPLDPLLAPDVEFVDHRPLGMGQMRGAERFARARRTQREVEEDLAVHVHEILALRPDAILMRWTTSGTARDGGGAFERPLLMLWAYAEDGRLARSEWFEPGEEAAALARFDELTAAPPPAALRERGDARAGALRALLARARLGSTWSPRFAPTFELDDRRALVGVPVSGEDFVANLRFCSR